ncbi:MAG: WYL domain-containing protein [Clostridiales bacterium]|nr:WYL domain-containing protein [Candidatus Cacconaster stercorequi]
MIFSELYSVYYRTVAKILSLVVTAETTEKDICRQISENAFSESVLTILPAFKEEKWQLLDRELTTSILHEPTMPLTLLEKRWLKAIMEDPRIKLFDVQMEGLEDVTPLFTAADYKVFDKYTDSDPYGDEAYIRNFKLVTEAIRTRRPIRITMTNRNGKEVWVRCFPQRLEYSEKDDKFRIIAAGCRYSQFNLGRITTCEFYNGHGPWNEVPRENALREVVLEIVDKRNALERVMMHFAHFEKQAEKVDDLHYKVRIRYYENDETEIVIRVLSFGPYVKVIEPESFVNLIKERLKKQKECELV